MLLSEGFLETHLRSRRKTRPHNPGIDKATVTAFLGHDQGADSTCGSREVTSDDEVIP